MTEISSIPIEQCEWCESTDTVWAETEEPDPHYDFPDLDIESGIVYVNLRRYCKYCESNYSVRMRFDVYSGKRVKE